MENNKDIKDELNSLSQLPKLQVLRLMVTKDIVGNRSRHLELYPEEPSQYWVQSRT